MGKLFSAFYFDKIAIIGVGALLVPLAFKLWRQAKEDRAPIPKVRLALLGLLFIFLWVLVGIASSIWISFMVYPLGGTRQSLLAQIWQSVWILLGLILSISKRATMGGILAALLGLTEAIGVGGSGGFIFGFLLGIISNTQSQGFGETVFDAFMIGIFGVLFGSFFTAIFVSPFTTLGGAIVGLFAEVFGKTRPYEKLLGRFRINSDHFA